MIGRVVAPGKDVAGLLYYLFGKGRKDEHVNPSAAARASRSVSKGPLGSFPRETPIAWMAGPPWCP